ncbi:hypothetical protein V5P93_007368 [Actinokineospora auranticolor]|uniref:Uncharacterized protein n=1 Tax=Actinokineospora auranticolor TaxID=155976 RepID=A0A2S6GS32_9PSEU|nr:hypothetical protein [Actinokineospora auranticolor]PPK68020.1 hypothetical protein CLV40_106253 [Actinokineospora auranticolor]
MGEKTRKPKVLRWLVLWVAFTVVGAVWLWVDGAAIFAGRALGANEVEATRAGVQVTVEEGDLLGLNPHGNGQYQCKLRTDSGEERFFLLQDKGMFERGARWDKQTVTMWFTGTATVTCDQSTDVRLPAWFERKRLLSGIGFGLLGVSAGCALLAGVNSWRRLRQSRNRTAPAPVG